MIGRRVTYQARRVTFNFGGERRRLGSSLVSGFACGTSASSTRVSAQTPSARSFALIQTSLYCASTKSMMPHYKDLLSRVGRETGCDLRAKTENDFKNPVWKSLSKRQLLIKHHCETVLLQVQYLLDMLNDEDYVQTLPGFFHATIGAHIRHTLQHVHHVTDMVGSHPEDVTTLSYDTRERNDTIETSRAKALHDTKKCLTVLSNMEADDFMLTVHAEFIGNSETGKKYAVSSSIERELSFVAHHATHHLALVNLMMKSLGYSVQKDVGVAHSTVMYHKGMQAGSAEER